MRKKWQAVLSSTGSQVEQQQRHKERQTKRHKHTSPERERERRNTYKTQEKKQKTHTEKTEERDYMDASFIISFYLTHTQCCKHIPVRNKTDYYQLL